MTRKKISLDTHFNDDICIVMADISSACLPDYKRLMEQYPLADGMRDISICLSCMPTDVVALAKAVAEGDYTWIGIGWLVHCTGFVAVAEQAGISTFEYADYLYQACDRINQNAGYRAAWIEAYGEIGNSVTWPQGCSYTKKEALAYFRDWFTSGRSNTEHWRKVVKPELMNFYKDAIARSTDLRNLPIYYSEGTLLALHEAFNFGFPLVAYEGQCGTMNAIQTGIAFVRGGAKMHDALWGCDFSPWTGAPLGEVASVDMNGSWKEGMTADYMYRTWIAAYMSGCNTLLHEVSYTFFYAEPREGLVILTDYGYNAMRFYAMKEGALAERGKTIVPIAIMLEEEHGYRGDMVREYTSSGELLSSDCNQSAESRLDIWYNRISHISAGDWQVHRLISHIWPLPDNKWAEATSLWPDEAVASIGHEIITELKNGKTDPREYARFLSDSRWADCFDVIIETASTETLKHHYKAIILAGEVKTDNGLWEKLTEFIESGGTVVASADQFHDELRKDLGISSNVVDKEIHISFGDECGTSGTEQAYVYGYDAQLGNDVLEKDVLSGEPLAIVKRIGRGKLVVMLISYGLIAGNRRISSMFDKIISSIYDEFVGVQRVGPTCQMLINETADETTVTLINHTNRLWNGSIVVKRSNRGSIDVVYDRITTKSLPDCDVQFLANDVMAVINVKAFDIRVVTFGSVFKERVRTWPTLASSFSNEAAVKIQKIIKDGPEAYL